MAMTMQSGYGVTYGFKKISKDVRGADFSEYQGHFHVNVVAANEQGIYAAVKALVTVPSGWNLEIQNYKAVMPNVYAN